MCRADISLKKCSLEQTSFLLAFYPPRQIPLFRPREREGESEREREAHLSRDISLRNAFDRLLLDRPHPDGEYLASSRTPCMYARAHVCTYIDD